jgi:hypothetical protein
VTLAILPNYQKSLKKLDECKRFSLFCLTINDKEKQFDNIDDRNELDLGQNNPKNRQKAATKSIKSYRWIM